MDPRHALDRLILACRDDEHLLRHETKLVDPNRAAVLSRLADERHAFVDALRTLPGTHDDSTHGSWRAVVRGLARDLRVVVTGPNSSDAVTACRRSRDRVDALYEDALEQRWPTTIGALLTSQHDRVHAEAETLLRVQF